MNILGSLVKIWYKLQLKTKVAIYGKLLAHLGEEVFIHPTVTLNWPERIYLADKCKLYRGAFLNARTTKDIGIRLGEGVKIHEYTYVDPYGGYIHLDDYVGIGHHCVIGGHGGLTVGKHTIIAGLTYIIPANHIIDRQDIPYIQQGETRKGIQIGSNVWIGANCVITDGVVIGDNAVIGAGAVVTNNIPANVIAVGIPAKPIKNLGGNVSQSTDKNN